MTWTASKTWVDGEPVGATDLNIYVRDNFYHLYQNAKPQRVRLWHDESYIIAGNALTVTPSSTQRFCYYAYQNASAINDEWSQSCYLLPSIYRFYVHGRTLATGGIADVYLNDEWFSFIDTYSAGTVNDVDLGGTVLPISEGKRHILRVKVASKNAASGGYDLQLNSITFEPYYGDK